MIEVINTEGGACDDPEILTNQVFGQPWKAVGETMPDLHSYKPAFTQKEV